MGVIAFMPLEAPRLQAKSAGVVLSTDTAFEGLTFQQLAYCKARMSGLNMTQAYLSAFDGKGYTPQDVYHRAWSLERNPKVVAKLRQLLIENEQPTTLLPTITRDYVLNGIAVMAATATKEATQLRAWELLGKAVGLFDKPDSDADQSKPLTSTSDIDAEIRRRLAGMLAPVVEGEARRVEQPEPVSRRRERRRKPRPETEGGH